MQPIPFKSDRLLAASARAHFAKKCLKVESALRDGQAVSAAVEASSEHWWTQLDHANRAAGSADAVGGDS